MKCELCEREHLLTFHHLIPKSQHSNKWFKKNFTKEQMNEGIDICKDDCHKQIHILISEKELGKKYNTVQKLKSHKEIKKYLKWVKERDQK